MHTPRIRVEAFCRRHFNERREAPEAVSWLADYYDGLLTQSGLEYDREHLARGRNNDFHSMASEVLREMSQRAPVHDTGLFLMAHQTLDTYFPFRSTTTLLCRDFSINCPAVSLTEQEQASPYIGLKILRAALAHQESVRAGLLLVLDQTTLPYRGTWDPEHSVDTALAIRCSADENARGPTLEVHHEWLGEPSTGDAAYSCMRGFLDERCMPLSDVRIVANAPMADMLAGTAAESVLHRDDPRYLSCAGLLRTMELLDDKAGCVLLCHLAEDGHLFLNLFRNDRAG